MTTNLTVVGQICNTLSLDSYEKRISDQLKETGVSAKRFLASAKATIQTHPDIDRLEKADRQSLYDAIERSAAEGLIPDGREAALVVYGNKVNYQPMVQGLVKLARNSGEIESIGAYVVYSKDKFLYRVGQDKMPSHEAEWFGDRGEPIGVWAFVKLKNGEYLEPVMMSKDRVARIASRSKQMKNYSSKEGKDWEEFWKKAAIRNVLKLAPRSTSLDKLLKQDDEEFDLANESVSLNEPLPEQKETRAAKIVKNPKTPIIDKPAPQIIEAEIEEINPYEQESPI